MSVFNAIAPPMNHCRAGTLIKSGFYSWSLLLVSSCVWALGPSVAECAPVSRTTASQELSALNLLGIRYARGQGVKRNPALAKRFFLRSAIQGYTPAMANLGTLYEIGARRDSDLRRAYAWVRAALSFGVPDDDHDETVVKLWMFAARLGPERIGGAERLADVIATQIVESRKCSPGQETELSDAQ
jgi:Sel1 repeat